MKHFAAGTRTIAVSVLTLAFAWSGAAQDIRAGHGKADVDWSRLVVVGDSVAAGVENGSLEASQQRQGFASLIARQVHTRLTLPLVPYPGAPNKLELVTSTFPPVIKPVPGTLLFPRLNPFEEVTNLAVPLQTVADALTLKPNNDLTPNNGTQAATNLVLGFPCPVLFPCNAGTQVQQAIARHPTAILLYLGNNDILGLITSGQLGQVASPAAIQAFLAAFQTNYQTLLTSLSATRATLIVANLPDVMESAYFVPVAKIAALLQIPVEQVAALLGTGTTDFVTADALPAVYAILTNAQPGPLPAACPAGGDTPCVVTAAQAAFVRQIIEQMNAIIGAETAAVPGSTVVNLFALTDRIYANGYKVGDATLTADFLGGLFSLDGLHPSSTGYAVLANEFIRQINLAYCEDIRPVNVEQIAKRDPLVLVPVR